MNKKSTAKACSNALTEVLAGRAPESPVIVQQEGDSFTRVGTPSVYVSKTGYGLTLTAGFYTFPSTNEGAAGFAATFHPIPPYEAVVLPMDVARVHQVELIRQLAADQDEAYASDLADGLA